MGWILFMILRFTKIGWRKKTISGHISQNTGGISQGFNVLIISVLLLKKLLISTCTEPSSSLNLYSGIVCNQ